jgi:hypothetical protein
MFAPIEPKQDLKRQARKQVGRQLGQAAWRGVQPGQGGRGRAAATGRAPEGGRPTAFDAPGKGPLPPRALPSNPPPSRAGGAPRAGGAVARRRHQHMERPPHGQRARARPAPRRARALSVPLPPRSRHRPHARQRRWDQRLLLLLRARPLRRGPRVPLPAPPAHSGRRRRPRAQQFAGHLRPRAAAGPPGQPRRRWLLRERRSVRRGRGFPRGRRSSSPGGGRTPTPLCRAAHRPPLPQPLLSTPARRPRRTATAPRCTWPTMAPAGTRPSRCATC